MEIRLRILEGRRTRLQERLDRVQHQPRDRRRVDRYASELQRHGVESVEREVRWLSDLINAERSTTSPGASPTHPPSPATPARGTTDRAQPLRPTQRLTPPPATPAQGKEGTAPWVRFE